MPYIGHVQKADNSAFILAAGRKDRQMIKFIAVSLSDIGDEIVLLARYEGSSIGGDKSDRQSLSQVQQRVVSRASGPAI
ncbi:MAG: hypothetical protein JZU55_04895 [Afipia sp.]|nr:hypothetical protein [Afipia sp.]